MKIGLTHVYYGYGKGKTTAAIGLALRMAGYGKKIVIVQFLKNRQSGEIRELEGIANFTVLRGQACDSFSVKMNACELAKTTEIHNENLSKAIEMVVGEQCDMLVLDEAIDAYQLGLLDRDLFENFIRNKPASLELVLTGHAPEAWILDCADYISEMKKKKHPYDIGIQARVGVEY